jgi:cell wall-associated NlpC family hydrolase
MSKIPETPASSSDTSQFSEAPGAAAEAAPSSGTTLAADATSTSGATSTTDTASAGETGVAAGPAIPAPSSARDDAAVPQAVPTAAGIAQLPQPGDFAVVRISGGVGRLIRVGQWLNGDGYSDFEHAFILVGDDMVIEAQPGGARQTPLAVYRDRPIRWSSDRIHLTDDQRAAIVSAAHGYLGVPYSFADYLALATHRFRLPGNGLLKDFVADTRHQICSQLVDQCYRDAGVTLFPNRRWPGYVTPADLAHLLA